jgi:hypothetical protein
MKSNILKYGLFFCGLIWIFQCEAQGYRFDPAPVLKEDPVNPEIRPFFVLIRKSSSSDEALGELKIAKCEANYNVWETLLYSLPEIYHRRVN